MTDNLIHRLEAAEGPSRELDGEIAIALVGRERVLLSCGKSEEHEWQPSWPESAIWLPMPEFTASLDAAVSLVPEGWQWWVRHNIAGEYTERPGSWYMAQVSEYMGKWRFEGISRATPALALCIAALKAREA